MNTETKNCQSCKKDFEITQEDFEFYEKMKVPAPTWCVDCSLQRRLVWRNERSLHKRKCDAPGHDEQLITVYSPDSNVAVYDQKYWWGNEWDGLDYGKDYDFSKPFFEQWRELANAVPRIAMFNINPVNSDYCNYTDGNKNCYLVFGGDFNENCSYSTFNFYSTDSLDLYFVTKCEKSYEVVDSTSCYNSKFVWNSKDCSNSAFIYNSVNCSDCLGCVNMRNAKYCIFNKQYSKEEYEEKVKEFKLNDYLHLQEFKKKFAEHLLKYPRKYANILRSVDCTGDMITEGKSCQNCFDVTGPAEDLKDFFLGGWGLKDARNANHAGHEVEMMYDSFAIFSGCSRAMYSMMSGGSHDLWYSYSCHGSGNLFGCVGVRSKNYCILNKQYRKEEYEELVPRIKKHMDEMPYVDKNGKEYRFGDFFPAEFSNFAYNETIAHEYFPLTKETAEKIHFDWSNPEQKDYKPTIKAADLPTDITAVNEDVLKEIIECEHKGECDELCSVAFRILPQELAFYQQSKLPLPRLCPSCRHYQRLRQRNPKKLWERKCQCAGTKSENGVYENTTEHTHGSEKCSVEMETPYAPDRPEIVYCEACYQQEVV